MLYLPAGLAALLLAAAARGIYGPTLDSSLFADRALDGEWLPVWVDLTASLPGAAGAVLGPALALLMAAVALVHVALAAGVVGALVERQGTNPFLLGIRRHTWPFLRAAAVYVVGLIPIAVVAGLTARGLFRLAAEQRDGRLDLLAVGLAALLAFLLWAPWDLAYDLARVAAVRHDERSMAPGMMRALREVLRRPRLLLPLAAAAVLLPLALHLVYGLLRSPWTPSTGIGIILLVAVQQTVMLGRAALRLWLWSASVEAYDHLGTPPWCRHLTQGCHSAVPAPSSPRPALEETGKGSQATGAVA